jgi:hypothetical protein
VYFLFAFDDAKGELENNTMPKEHKVNQPMHPNLNREIHIETTTNEAETFF